MSADQTEKTARAKRKSINSNVLEIRHRDKQLSARETEATLGEKASKVEDTYKDSDESSDKSLINRFIVSQFAAGTTCLLYNSVCNILILDGPECRTMQEFKSFFYSALYITNRHPTFRLYCTNNTASWTKIQSSYKENWDHTNATRESRVMPISVQDYLSKKYEYLYEIPKEGFHLIYFDFCGEFHTQLEPMEKFLMDACADTCLLAVTLCKRGESNVIEKTKKWFTDRRWEGQWIFHIERCHSYGNMFTLVLTRWHYLHNYDSQTLFNVKQYCDDRNWHWPTIKRDIKKTPVKKWLKERWEKIDEKTAWLILKKAHLNFVEQGPTLESRLWRDSKGEDNVWQDISDYVGGLAGYVENLFYYECYPNDDFQYQYTSIEPEKKDENGKYYFMVDYVTWGKCKVYSEDLNNATFREYFRNSTK